MVVNMFEDNVLCMYMLFHNFQANLQNKIYRNMTNVRTQLHFLACEMETTLFPLPQVPYFHISIAIKAEPFILQKIYQRTNYNIKWGGVPNSLNDK